LVRRGTSYPQSRLGTRGRFSSLDLPEQDANKPAPLYGLLYGLLRDSAGQVLQTDAGAAAVYGRGHQVTLQTHAAQVSAGVNEG
jgi:hypothetical protein